MANKRSAGLLFVGGHCSAPLAKEFKRILRQSKTTIASAMELWMEIRLEDYYAIRGQPIPKKILDALETRRQNRAARPWLARRGL